MHTQGSYREVFEVPGVQPFLWLQFFNAFNDNMYKIVVSLLAVKLMGQAQSGGLFRAGEFHFCRAFPYFCHVCRPTGRPV